MADGKLDLELILRKVIRQDASGELTIEKVLSLKKAKRIGPSPKRASPSPSLAQPIFQGKFSVLNSLLAPRHVARWPKRLTREVEGMSSC